MNRRNFITRTTALLGAAALAGLPTFVLAENDFIEYTPGLIEEKLAAGETVFVDYAATWCSTCKRQERVLSELRKNNAEFDSNITFIKVDWDTYSKHEVTTSRKIPRRSTLLLLKGDEELGRIVAGTKSDDIAALLQLAIPST